MNQRDFAKRINVSQPTLTLMEKGERTIRDIHISRICEEFNVNEDWIREGTGEMLIKKETVTLDEFAKMNNLTNLESNIIRGYMGLDENVRKVLIDLFKEMFAGSLESSASKEVEVEKKDSEIVFVEKQDENEEEDQEIEEVLNKMRIEMKAVKKGRTSSASQRISGKSS